MVSLRNHQLSYMITITIGAFKLCKSFQDFCNMFACRLPHLCCKPPHMSHEKYKICIDACNICAVACEHCASEDLKEKDVQMMMACINLDRECAAICRAAAHIMSMGGRFSKDICALCATVCDACAQECEKHPHMEHCLICAVECRQCAIECRKMAALL